MEFIIDNTTDQARPFLTAEQLDYAKRLGITEERAYWLASCPKFTDYSIPAPKNNFHAYDPERSYLYKQPGGDLYYFRINRKNLFIMRKLSKDFEKAKAMRDAIIKQMNLTLKK